MAWIQVHQTLKDHRKLFDAADELEISPPHMMGLLISFWLWALDNAPTGKLDGITHRMIARAAQYEGDAEKLAAALIRAGLEEPGLCCLRPAEGPALPVTCPMMAWPEERINTSEELLPFSVHPFELAWREGLPIAIASLRGSETVARWVLRPAQVGLRILGVIPPGEYGELDGEKLAQIARERITDDLLREDN